MNDDFMFMMFVLEEQKKEYFAKELALSPDPEDPDEIKRIADLVHIDLCSLSEYDWKEIYSKIQEES